MRAQRTIAVVLIVLFAGLAGCIGGTKETPEGGDPIDPAGLSGTGTGGTGGPAQINVLAGLSGSLAIDAPAWVQSGTEAPVSLTTGAKGTLNYTWALGPLPGTAPVTDAKADTGSTAGSYIAAGASKSITYGTSGIYRMHCHPHPWMRHNVTVVDGYAGPKAVEVLIIDGATQDKYRYVPENIIVGPGTVVTYKNVGMQPHTATSMGAQEPALKKLPLTGASGNVKIEGNGWQRVVVVFQDGEGRFGMAEKAIYTTPTLPAFATKTVEFSFDAGASQLYATPAGSVAPQPKSEPVQLEQAGLVSINYTFTDPFTATPAETQSQVEVHFTKDGETQDTLTGGPNAEDSLTGKAQAGAYTLRVVPVQGAQMTGTVTIEVVYELVPPSPSAPAPAGDGHGGHAH